MKVRDEIYQLLTIIIDTINNCTHSLRNILPVIEIGRAVRGFSALEAAVAVLLARLAFTFVRYPLVNDSSPGSFLALVSLLFGSSGTPTATVKHELNLE